MPAGLQKKAESIAEAYTDTISKVMESGNVGLEGSLRFTIPSRSHSYN